MNDETKSLENSTATTSPIHTDGSEGRPYRTTEAESPALPAVMETNTTAEPTTELQQSERPFAALEGDSQEKEQGTGPVATGMSLLRENSGARRVTRAVVRANRLNAGRSTGPRTAEGKAVSRLNAIRHGILSNEVVVRGLRIREKHEEFEALREEFRAELAPEGAVEEMLVNRVVTTHWRLRRVLMAESGEVALSVDGGQWQRAHAAPLTSLLTYTTEDVVGELTKTAAGLDFLVLTLEMLREDVGREGRITDEALERMRTRFGRRPNSLLKDLQAVQKNHAEMVVGGPEGPVSEEEKREMMMEAIRRRLEVFEDLRRERQKRETKEEMGRQAADMLPSGAVLEKIGRYEMMLERQMYRALNQLERIQRRRMGEDVPPPVEVEVMRRG